MSPLPIPHFFDPSAAVQAWRVPYEERAAQAREWAAEHNIQPAARDDLRIALLAVDVQNTFCLPDFELFVAGRSGTGAVDDSIRLCNFIYKNLDRLTQIAVTLDTHTAMQIFHAVFLVDDEGNHPGPLTQITTEDVRRGRWRFNPALSGPLGVDDEFGPQHLAYYAAELQEKGKYNLTIWPYHAMLGGLGHALVSLFEEALFFHSLARYSPPDFIVKGQHPFTEHYSAVGPEVTKDTRGATIARNDRRFMQKVLEFDAVVIAGQAKSHCVAWTVSDLLDEILETDPALARKVYLLEDCSSPVVVQNLVDFTEQAERAFDRFAKAGMHLVRSTDILEDWPELHNQEGKR